MAERRLEFILSLKDQASQNLQGFRNQLTGAHAQMGAMTVAMGAAGLAIGTAFVAAERSAIQFNTQMRNVNSIAQLNEQQFHQMEKAVLGLSARLPQSADVLAKGLYNIVSSGFEGAKALEVLEVAAKGASAGLTTTDTSARILTAVMNSFGQNVYTPQKAMDILFKTVDKGVLSFDELAQQLGEVLPTAASAGINLEQLGAAMAVMTRRGLSAAEAATSLNQVIVSFIDPSKEAKDAAQALGIELNVGALRSKGLSGVISELVNKTGIYKLVLEEGGSAMKQQTNAINEQTKGTLNNIEAQKIALARQKETIESQYQAAAARYKEMNSVKGQTTTQREATATAKANVDALKQQKQAIQGQVDALSLQGREARLNATAQRGAVLDANVSNEKLTKVLEKAGKNANLSSEQMALLFGNIRSLRGILSLTGDDGALFNEMLKEMENSAGATDRALSQQSKSLEYQFNILKNSVTALAIQALIPFNETVAQTLDKFNKWAFVVTNDGVRPSEQLLDVWNKLKVPLAIIGGILASAATRWLILVGVIKPAIMAFNVMKYGVVGLRMALAPLLKLLMGVAGVIAAALGAPVWAVVAAMAALAAIAFVVWKNWDTVKKFFSDLGASITEGFGKADAAVGSWIDSSNQAIAGWATSSWAAITGFFTGLPGYIAEKGTQAAEGFANFVEASVRWLQLLPERAAFYVGLMIGTTIRGYIELPGRIAATAGAIWAAVTALWAYVGTIISNSWNSARTNTVNFFSALPGQIMAFGSALWSATAQTFNSSVNASGAALAALPGRVNNAFWAAVNTISAFAAHAWNASKHFANTAYNAIVSTIQQLPGRINQLFWDTLNVIGGMSSNMFNKAKSVASSFWDGIKQGLGIRSPSYVEKAFMAISAQADKSVREVQLSVNSIKASAKTMSNTQIGGYSVVDAIQGSSPRVNPGSNFTDNSSQSFAPQIVINMTGNSQSASDLRYAAGQSVIDQQYRALYT